MWSKDSRSTASSQRSLKLMSPYMHSPKLGLRDKLKTALQVKKYEEQDKESPVFARALELRDRQHAMPTGRRPAQIPPLQRNTLVTTSLPKPHATLRSARTLIQLPHPTIKEAYNPFLIPIPVSDSFEEEEVTVKELLKQLQGLR